MVVERQLSLTGARAEVIPLELREGSELRVEAVHLSGAEVSVLLLDKDGIAKFRTTQRVAAYPALSRAGFGDRFDSGWHRLPGAVYSVVAVQQSVKKDASAPPVPSGLNLRVYTR